MSALKVGSTQYRIIAHLLEFDVFVATGRRERTAAAKLAARGSIERIPGGSHLTGIRYCRVGDAERLKKQGERR